MGKNTLTPKIVLKKCAVHCTPICSFFVAQGTNFGYIHISFVIDLLDQIWWWLMDMFL